MLDEWEIKSVVLVTSICILKFGVANSMVVRVYIITELPTRDVRFDNTMLNPFAVDTGLNPFFSGNCLITTSLY